MIIDGKKIAEEIRQELKKRVEKLKKEPTLAIVLVGERTDCKIYVKNKQKACEELGIKIINCSPGSALDFFETNKLENIL